VYYVSSVLKDIVTIKSVGDDGATLPEDLPSPEGVPPAVSVPFNGKVDLATLLGRLRDHGVALGGDHSGWPPAAVFEDLRDQGLVTGPYMELMFRGLGKWETRSR
jgi:hypothetical protein